MHAEQQLCLLGLGPEHLSDGGKQWLRAIAGVSEHLGLVTTDKAAVLAAVVELRQQQWAAEDSQVHLSPHLPRKRRTNTRIGDAYQPTRCQRRQDTRDAGALSCGPIELTHLGVAGGCGGGQQEGAGADGGFEAAHSTAGPGCGADCGAAGTVVPPTRDYPTREHPCILTQQVRGF